MHEVIRKLSNALWGYFRSMCEPRVYQSLRSLCTSKENMNLYDFGTFLTCSKARSVTRSSGQKAKVILVLGQDVCHTIQLV